MTESSIPNGLLLLLRTWQQKWSQSSAVIQLGKIEPAQQSLQQQDRRSASVHSREGAAPQEEQETSDQPDDAYTHITSYACTYTPLHVHTHNPRMHTHHSIYTHTIHMHTHNPLAYTPLHTYAHTHNPYAYTPLHMHTHNPYTYTPSGELIVSRYVAESITMIAGRFGHIGLCQLRTKPPHHMHTHKPAYAFTCIYQYTHIITPIHTHTPHP